MTPSATAPHSSNTAPEHWPARTPPPPKADRPHAVQQASVTGGANNGRTSTFAYDDAGNTTQRSIGATVQDLTWDSEGHLATLTQGGKTTSYLYDAAGQRLITKDADGSQTLTLPGGNELKVAANGTKTGTRYYDHNDETVAVRTGADIAYLISDHQGTAMTAVAAVTLAITRRKQLPFGQTRSEQGAQLPGTRGFVGGTNDPTGLTHLGAREYDPTLGRFLSVDPVIDFSDPAQMNAYSYAHNNPVTKSDPTGLRPAGPTDGGASADDAWARDRGMNAGYVLKNGKYVWVQTPKKDKASQKKYAAYQANPSNYKVYHYNAKVAAASKAAAEARAADRAKAAQEQRRKEDGIFGSITKGNWSNAWENAKESTKDAFDYASTYSNTSGICVSAGGAIGLGIEFTGCIIGTKRPDGKTDYSLSGTFEEQVGPGVGGAATLSAVYSNADDIDQIRGEAAGMGGTVGYGLAFNGSHRGTFGTRNSRGDIVHSFTQGVGAGYGAEANFGSGVTGVHKLFTW